MSTVGCSILLEFGTWMCCGFVEDTHRLKFVLSQNQRWRSTPHVEYLNRHNSLGLLILLKFCMWVH